jgi:hypothetical protein
LAQTNINLNNLTFQMLKERQSQISSQHISSQQPCTSNGPVGTTGGKVNGFITKTISGMVINYKPSR